MRFPKKNTAVSGEVNIPIIPIIFVVCALLLIIAYNSVGRITLTQGFQIEPTDVGRTDLRATSEKTMDVTIFLFPPAAARLREYAASHPSTDIPIIASGSYIGNVTVKPGTDASVLKISTTPDKAMTIKAETSR